MRIDKSESLAVIWLICYLGNIRLKLDYPEYPANFSNIRLKRFIRLNFQFRFLFKRIVLTDNPFPFNT